MLDVCLLGTSGMMPLPKRWLTALMTRYNGNSLLIDCGEGTQLAIKEQGWSFNPIDIICFTHYHGDHISGLPGLLLTMGNADRREPVTMIGPKGLERVVNSLRVIAPELPFEIRFIEITEPEQIIYIKGYKIHAFKVLHNITCYGYNIEIERNGKFLVEKAESLSIPRKGIKLTYCTDTRPIPLIAQMAKEADLFICEGMYGEKDKEGKAREYKHMTFHEAARLGREAGPKEMWLTHYSPSLIHPEEFMKEIREIFENIYPGKDGKTLTLKFRED